MKKFKVISNIITVLILAIGAIPCIVAYVDHSLNCHGCSMHVGYPAVELMTYSLVILFSGAVFGVSRLILRLYRKKSTDGFKDKVPKSKFEKWIYVLILAILTAGLANYIAGIILELTEFSFSFSALLFSIIYTIPYIWLAATVFVISRLLLLTRNNENGSSSREKSVRSKSEKIIYILVLIILLAGFLNYIYIFEDEWPRLSYSNSFFDALAAESIYMIPYLFLSGVILVIYRLIRIKKANEIRR